MRVACGTGPVVFPRAMVLYERDEWALLSDEKGYLEVGVCLDMAMTVAIFEVVNPDF